jgi:acyl-CoA synthetase (NDP forming)
LEVPPISDNTRKELNTFIRLAGNSTRNPLDIWMVQDDVNLFHRAMELSVADPAIDLAIIERHVGDSTDDDNDYNPQDHKERQREINDSIINFAKKTSDKKPLVVAMSMFGNDPANVASAARLRQEFAIAGVPAYVSPDSAARALARFVKYHEFQMRIENNE